jgi:hypothetical protein
MFTKDRGSVPGTILVIIMFAVIMLGVIMIISDYESTRAPFLNATNGTDPTGGVLIGAGYNRTTAITTALVGMGSDIIWLFVLAAFVVLFFGIVYFYLKR